MAFGDDAFDAGLEFGVAEVVAGEEERGFDVRSLERVEDVAADLRRNLRR